MGDHERQPEPPSGWLGFTSFAVRIGGTGKAEMSCPTCTFDNGSGVIISKTKSVPSGTEIVALELMSGQAEKE
ncbi:MAG: hypothetical protein A3G59_02820 [Candidatus Taylorbacteria bacterium RIFCSPLOWO2_12_FULL_47_20]|uniref:Uncharacterized protein n=2 Tax=Candidatus Tayloriibacteriota TaxID=1817919 RepID=A0A1G2P7F3_9BACT|nr:MAG: hypothetical protein A3H68_01575 [Candidatus Taylorbacteria bacterium RIFCSPLOWO2_02_FULL_46_40]OHA43552.1 MAG: hypothetical protein A3G59_02820 [Candidatus Taylorbacteria bacterium RIFCSPLOWO2_12_FULL_47_20]